MKAKYTKLLGIAVGERSMLVAEVQAGSPAARVIKAAEFRYPEGQSLKDSEPLGAALAQFLKDQGFGTRTAVFGLPARWVLSKSKDVPTTDETLLADTLRLQATAEFSPEFTDLVYDYSGNPARDGSHAVLLMAVSAGKYVNPLNAIAEAAKIKVVGVAPYSAALASVTAQPSRTLQTVLLGPSGIEFAATQGGSPRMLRYMGANAEASPLFVGELRRASAQAPVNGTTSDSRPELILWNDAGVNEQSFLSLGDSLNVAVRNGRLSDFGVEGGANGTDGRAYAAPVALAVAAMSDRLPVDFSHSRLAPPPEKKIDRRLVLGIAAALAIIIGTGYWYYSLHSQDTQIAAEKQQLNDYGKIRKARQDEVTHIEFASGWHASEPRYISCLRDLTTATPESGELYGQNLSLKDDMTGSFSGKARNEATVLNLVERMKQSRHFNPVSTTSMDLHQDKAGKEVSFMITFTYVPNPGNGADKWSSPTVKKVSQ
ncbi:MAG TPA: hypothetical protein VN541_20210 [Tepidisphaeraceae bacterium]|nr:hypothetical protein [Tepidisphaeraceae bacterium]